LTITAFTLAGSSKVKKAKHLDEADAMAGFSGRGTDIWVGAAAHEHGSRLLHGPPHDLELANLRARRKEAAGVAVSIVDETIE